MSIIIVANCKTFINFDLIDCVLFFRVKNFEALNYRSAILESLITIWHSDSYLLTLAQ